MKWTGSLNIRNKILMLKVQLIDKPRFETNGMCSRIPMGLGHVLFLDYDLIDHETLLEELEALQQEFALSDFYVFRTREIEGKNYGGYHAVCLDIFSLWEVNQIILMTSCDHAFKIAPRFCEYRSWVLRTDKKGNREAPVFDDVLHSKYYDGERQQSSAHKIFLEAKYGIKIVLENPDSKYFLDGIKYLTANRCGKRDES